MNSNGLDKIILQTAYHIITLGDFNWLEDSCWLNDSLADFSLKSVNGQQYSFPSHNSPLS
jgi:Ulp1 family protease